MAPFPLCYISGISGVALVFSLTFACGAHAQTAAPDGKIMVEAQTKPDKEWKFYPTRTLEILPDYTPVSKPVETDIYGGWPQVKARATGFFTTTIINGRFWLIDPLGNGFINKAVVSVGPGDSQNMKANLQTKYGSEQKWAAATAQMLRAHGFNGSGSWSKDELLRGAPQRLTYTPMWNFMSSYGKKRGGTKQQPGHTGYPNNAIFVLTPNLRSFATSTPKSWRRPKTIRICSATIPTTKCPFPKNR